MTSDFENALIPSKEHERDRPNDCLVDCALSKILKMVLKLLNFPKGRRTCTEQRCWDPCNNTSASLQHHNGLLAHV